MLCAQEVSGQYCCISCHVSRNSVCVAPLVFRRIRKKYIRCIHLKALFTLPNVFIPKCFPVSLMAVQALCTEQHCNPLCPAGSGLRCPPAMGQPCSLPTTGLRSWATAVFSAGTKLAISAGKRGVESFLSTCKNTSMGSRVDHKSFLYSIWML